MVRFTITIGSLDLRYLQNVLNEGDLKLISDKLKSDNWGFGYTSTDNKKPIWNYNHDYSRTIAELVASKLKGYELVTWHINGQTLGQHGAWHTDQAFKEFSCTHAFIFFFQEWNYEWGGRLHIKIGNETLIITPEKNTGILFDANNKHYAEAPTEPYLFRMSIGLKLNKVESV